VDFLAVNNLISANKCAKSETIPHFPDIAFEEDILKKGRLLP